MAWQLISGTRELRRKPYRQ